jgi:hypothetical protein
MIDQRLPASWGFPERATAFYAAARDSSRRSSTLDHHGRVGDIVAQLVAGVYEAGVAAGTVQAATEACPAPVALG